MRALLDYVKGFPFKNLLAAGLVYYLLYLLGTHPDLKDIITIFLTLVLKYYFDSSITSSKKDETISAALAQAQISPATGGGNTVRKADTVNVTK